MTMPVENHEQKQECTRRTESIEKLAEAVDRISYSVVKTLGHIDDMVKVVVEYVKK